MSVSDQAVTSALSEERYHGCQQKMVAIGFTIVKHYRLTLNSWNTLCSFTPAVLLLLGDV